MFSVVEDAWCRRVLREEERKVVAREAAPCVYLPFWYYVRALCIAGHGVPDFGGYLISQDALP